MIWGEVSSWLSKRQEHSFEIQRLRLQDEIDEKAHARNLAAIQLQAELGEKQIRVAGEVAANAAEIQGWVAAQRQAFKPTGIRWVDAWNSVIRPSFATVALGLWILMVYRNGFVPSQWDLDLIGAVAGFFFADRSLGKRGK